MLGLMRTGWSPSVPVLLTACSIGMLAACGSDVVIHPEGAGAAGASTTTGPTVTTTTATVTTVTTATTTGTTITTTGTGGAGAGIPALCSELCDLAATCGYDPSCAAECASTYTPPCASVYAAFLQCVIGAFDPSLCELPAECEQLMHQWTLCEGEEPPPPPCGMQGCSMGSDGGCSCSMECDVATYESTCVPQANGAYCRCSLDGDSVGDCVGGGPMPCDLLEGCCAAYFFWQDY